jgi:hypothetical protein
VRGRVINGSNLKARCGFGNGCLPDNDKDQRDGEQDPLVKEVLLGGARAAGGHAVALHPPEVRAHEHHEPEQEPRDEPADVSKVVHVWEDADHKVHNDHGHEGHHGRGLVGVDGPVGEELRDHGAEETEEGAGGADGDCVPDEQRGQDTAAEPGEEVNCTDSD